MGSAAAAEEAMRTPASSPGWGHAITPRQLSNGPLSPMLMAMTPPECTAMLQAVEDAMQRAASSTPLSASA